MSKYYCEDGCWICAIQNFCAEHPVAMFAIVIGICLTAFLLWMRYTR